MSEISFSEGKASDVLEGLHESSHELRTSGFIGTASEQDLVLLARFGSEVVGYLAASSERLGDLVVWEHAVAPDFRGRGVGRRLLLEAARRTPPTSRITIDPTGDFAIEKVAAYYSRLGFPPAPDDRFSISVAAHKVVDAVGEQIEEHATLETILRRKPPSVVTIAPDAPIIEAVALLNDMNIGSVVVSVDGRVIDGILSERDVVVAAHAWGAAMLDAKVRDCMTTEVISAEVTDDIAQVMEVVTIERLRHLPVTDGGVLVGVVSVGDLLVFRMREHDMRRDRLPYRAN